MTKVLPVLIIGGGFSGVMLAARLAEKGRASLIIEQSAQVGLGVAYGTSDDSHRLNVRCANMGALASDAGGFLKWLHTHHPAQADGDAFISRRLYGQYLQERFEGVRQSHPDLMATAQGCAVAISGLSVVLDDGHVIEGSDIVIATGNPSPHGAHTPTPTKTISDPWAKDALNGILPDQDIFILGTSLTMADMLMGLLDKGWHGKATVLSRRGLMPRPHIAGHPPAPAMPVEATDGPLSQRLHTARRMARDVKWQSVMDGYRPITGKLWQLATHKQRARFLRHLRPWWDVHRHRIAADVHDTLNALQAEGRLQVHAGRLVSVTADNGALDIRWQPSARSSSHTDHARADYFINCTGPAHDALGTPLTASLIKQGRARLEALGQGLDLDAQGHLVNHDGLSEQHIFALGPPSRAAYWESTAVPDIRQRIEVLSDLLVQ